MTYVEKVGELVLLRTSCYIFYFFCCPDDVIYSDDVIPTDVRLYRRNNSRRTGRIFMKFWDDVMPLKPSLKSFIYSSLNY
jgi:hypothetical protein